MTRLAFSIPTHGEEEQRRLFAGFREAGYQGLQLKGGQYLRYVTEPQRFQEDWGQSPELVTGLIFGGGLDAEGQMALRQTLAFASAVGSERVIFCHGLSHAGVTPDDVRGFARTLSELGQQARQQGVALSLHHHFDQPVMTPNDLRVFFDAVTPGSVGLTLDTAHLAKSGVWDIAAVVREFAPVLDNVHVKDFAAGQFVPLGQGDIDFAPVVAALRESHYTGWLCADEESGAGVAAGMAEAHAFLVSHWPEASHADHTR